MAIIAHPTLLSSCKLAATAAEARFRVNYPNSRSRASRIFALDSVAAEAMYDITEQPWQGAHFLTVVDKGPIDPGSTLARDLPLSHPDGTVALLDEEIEGADVVIMISALGRQTGAAEVVAREAYNRKIMLAGLVLVNPDSKEVNNRIVSLMRPFATVLVVAADPDFIPAMLSALRA